VIPVSDREFLFWILGKVTVLGREGRQTAFDFHSWNFLGIFKTSLLLELVIFKHIHVFYLIFGHCKVLKSINICLDMDTFFTPSHF